MTPSNINGELVLTSKCIYFLDIIYTHFPTLLTSFLSAIRMLFLGEAAFCLLHTLPTSTNVYDLEHF